MNQLAKDLSTNFDVERYRKDFPALHQEVHYKPLVYLDNAATSQKPQSVIDAIHTYYTQHNSNVHRGVHTLSGRATDLYEATREKIAHHINANSSKEIIFTKGATEALNLLAFSFGEHAINEGDEIIVSGMEHHSNLVPWQLLCERKGATLKILPITIKGELELSKLAELISSKTRLISVVHTSNALGTVNPVNEIIRIAHQHDIPVAIDGSQALPHAAVDMQALDAEFFIFTAHKMFGPTGVGVLYGKEDWLDRLPPYQGGGDMIRTVTYEKSEYSDLPYKFEAGTPNIAGVVGLGATLDYLQTIGMHNIASYEKQLVDYAVEQALAFDGLTLIGQPAQRSGVLSFVIDGVHPHDIGTIVDFEGVAIRTGHHCAMPVMDFFGVPATARASFAFYNTFSEVDALFAALEKTKALLN
ncbi:MAG: cysteine desulfurase [Gammaproteobacteria bacterium]|nr:cysteine desulfurase [Gammaproteobacteria bacterium]NNC97440.1 cysteine desulfurase [Gammaproteobacteria bacterium]NNM13913.1 cysteine desulfurase [Gammaproteobacteria bacterium]